MNIFKECPLMEGGRYLLRLTLEDDCDELLRVYSDEKALPLFNGDNCNGDDFHYTTGERMLEAIRFWIWSYENGWFVRWTILDRQSGGAIGTVELCRQGGDWTSNDGRGILRIDLRSDYERWDVIRELLALLLPGAFDWFACDRIVTKAKPSAKERLVALEEYGFQPNTEPVMGHDGTVYGDYYVIRRITEETL